MSDCPCMQGWASGETGMGSLVSANGDLKYPLQNCPLWPHQVEDVVLMMCMFLGIFIPTDLFRGVCFFHFFCWLLLWFLQVTHNNYGFMLFLCQTLTIH